MGDIRAQQNQIAENETSAPSRSKQIAVQAYRELEGTTAEEKNFTNETSSEQTAAITANERAPKETTSVLNQFVWAS